MAGFTADLEAMLAAVDQMSQFEGQLEQSLARAKASVESLGLSWQGDAASAQQAAQAQWNSGAEELRAALGQLRDITEQAHANYSQAAQMNTRMWA
jgi:WXG100 family type VII secretion target